MRPVTLPPDRAIRALLDPRRIVRWIYMGRLSLASSLYLAALFAWEEAPQAITLISSLAFACAMVFTVASAVFTEVHRRPLGLGFRYLQTVFDLLLVTAAVHVTGGSRSQFTALYILVIVAATLLLPTRGGVLVAALGIVLHFTDAILVHGTNLDVGVWMQLVVFGVVALGSGYLSVQLKEAGAGREELVAELAKARLEAADILRNIRSGILTIDSHGRLLYANPSAADLLGLDLDEALGAPILETVASAAPELALALSQSAQQGVRINRGEGTITVGARSFPIGVTTTFTAEDGRPTTATAIFQDISDQKRLEALHLRAHRLEAVAELSASLAHEIRNPLASIRSAVEQLARVPAASDDERTLGQLIVRESDRLSRLLAEFLDFARVRVARLETVDIGAVARAVASLVEAHPDRLPGVRIALEIPNRPVTIDGDEDLLHRAVCNLAINAVQAAPEHSTVRLRLERRRRHELPPGVTFDGDVVALSVSDEGPGIDAEARDRLFDPFFTTKPGGSGLGLAIAHRAIEAHRGVVLLDTGRGGTCFTILLPYTQPHSGTDASPSGERELRWSDESGAVAPQERAVGGAVTGTAIPHPRSTARDSLAAPHSSRPE